MLPINDLFETIQGEAYKAGTPSLFVHLRACPVRCPWCDTQHIGSPIQSGGHR